MIFLLEYNVNTGQFHKNTADHLVSENLCRLKNGLQINREWVIVGWGDHEKCRELIDKFRTEFGDYRHDDKLPWQI